MQGFSSYVAAVVANILHKTHVRKRYNNNAVDQLLHSLHKAGYYLVTTGSTDPAEKSDRSQKYGNYA